MLSFAKIYFIVFGLLTIFGGYMGFRAGSTISLVAGGVSGILLAAGGWMLRSDSTPLFIGLAVVSAALLVQGVRSYMKAGAFMPGGLMVVFSLIGLAIAVALIFTRPPN